MAFDGITVSGIVAELSDKLADGRIAKIYQPESDELNIVFKLPKTEDCGRRSLRLMMSASPSLPLCYLTEDTKENPLTAPNFCMLLRKHLSGGKLLSVTQPGFERIIEFRFSHLDELVDVCEKKLIVELMGKHSNIIFVDMENRILDSIKHVGAQISSVREVLPGREYVSPPSQGKCSPFDADITYIKETVLAKPLPVARAFCDAITGFSYVMGQELAFSCGIDGDASLSSLPEEKKDALAAAFMRCREQIARKEYHPVIYEKNGEPCEYAVLPLTMYQDSQATEAESVSQMLYAYYAKKDAVTRIRQKSADLRRIVNTAIERTSRKYDLQRKQLRDTDKREKYKIYGELIHTYGYSVEPGAKSFRAMNYYTGEEITIPLDETLSAIENGKRYFDKYSKLKRTYEALSVLINETEAELNYLLSVQNALDIARTETDLKEIKEELRTAGVIRKAAQTKGERREKSVPLHYISSDGFHMYVGKNNIQNEYLTFKLANSGDMWFHAKQMPGSHVIVKLEGASELPDSTYEDAARLAAYYSSGRTSPKVEIDYTKRGQLKKPPGAKPGYVIYHTNYSMVAKPDIEGIREAE